MTCEIYDGACEHCCEPYCPDKIEEIYTEHAELKKAVEDAMLELEGFVEEYGEVL